MIECEYCAADDVILYGWQGDVWCGACILEHKDSPFLSMTGTLKDAPMGYPANCTYKRPYIYQTPDGAVVGGYHRLVPE